MSRVAHVAAVAAATLALSAHVGSPDTYYEGSAGPYRVRVIVRSAGVVPGLAQITVRLLGGARARTVTVLPVYWDPRTAAPPPPDTARVVSGDSSVYDAALWLMTGGSYGVQVAIAGPLGTGATIVPVLALATRRLELQKPLALGLAAFGAFLFIGALTIIGAAVRESVLPPGAEPDRRRVWSGRIAAGAGGVMLVGAVLGGRSWWNAVDQGFSRQLYRPLASTAAVRREGGRAVLRLSIVDSAWRQHWVAPLIPDHGHLVHVFMVRAGALDPFAHLHPVFVDSSDFDAALPPLPAGRYRVYADITRESGFAETLTDTLTLQGSTTQWHPTDPDDAWIETGNGDRGMRNGDTATLGDGSRMIWNRGSAPLVAGQDAPLAFTVVTRDGRPVTLEPYMGISAHLMLSRDDGTVFVHLHPQGTISWAAQQTFLLRGPADTIRGVVGRRLTQADAGMRSMAAPPGASGEVSFPYAFPRAGHYRLWLQVKHSGKILTGVFDTEVR